MAKNFLNLETDLAIQVHEAHRLPNNLMRYSLGQLSKVNFFFRQKKYYKVQKKKKKACNL